MQADNEIILSLLPASVVELIDLIGFENTFKLVNLYGGTHLDIPRRAREQHCLNDIIGFEAFKCLCLRYGSTKLEIVRCVKFLKSVKHKAIVQEFNSGMTNAQLARKYQTDERMIRRIKRKIYEKEVVNFDLFEDFFSPF
jgi:hypothetical protein